MPRRKGMVKSTLLIREDLEAALGALADYDECYPLVELRTRQAIRRAGLDSLLVPALEDLARMVADVRDAREQICAALGKVE